MALFGGQRDIARFRQINRELIHRVISQEAIIFKLNLDVIETNIYGEADSSKIYKPGVRAYCLIMQEEQQYIQDDKFGINVEQPVTFAFLRDDLVRAQCQPEAGDVVDWNGLYFEINNIVNTQLILGKNSEYPGIDVGTTFGSNWSYVVRAHYTQTTKLNVEEI